MKVKKTTNLLAYGFQKDQYGMWYQHVEEYSAKGKDKINPVQIQICIFDDREICMNINNDHVQAIYDNPNDVEDEFRADETFALPSVILKLIKDDQVEPEQQA
jgi:hypothetical protein